MKKKRFGAEQIVAILKQAELGIQQTPQRVIEQMPQFDPLIVRQDDSLESNRASRALAASMKGFAQVIRRLVLQV